jgi:molybdopterin converting factor subunit 1
MSLRPPLRIRVRLFAMQREIAGTRELRLEVPLGSTVDDAWSAVVETTPALAPGRAFLRFAVNGSYTDPDAILHDGDEIACIPPVSGGSEAPAAPDDDPDPRLRLLEIREAPFEADLAGSLADRLATPADGGIVTFVGRTRVTPGTPAPGQEAEAARHAGRTVEALEYEAFEPMAITVLGQIADEIETRWGVRRVAIVHRTGPVPLGEPSILVVAAAPHRDAAFSAARYAIDETKARAPIWKAERFADGHVWIGHPARVAADDAGTADDAGPADDAGDPESDPADADPGPDAGRA